MTGQRDDATGRLPARTLLADADCVAVVCGEPLRQGHVIVTPRRPIAHWIDLPGPVAERIIGMSQVVGRAVQEVFGTKRVGLLISDRPEGITTALNVVPIDSDEELTSGVGAPAPESALDDTYRALRRQLTSQGISVAKDEA